jgi:hypothetical protein
MLDLKKIDKLFTKRLRSFDKQSLMDWFEQDRIACTEESLLCGKQVDVKSNVKESIHSHLQNEEAAEITSILSLSHAA